MKVVVIGGGGREHALVKKLKESAGCNEIFVLPGNGGTAEDAKNIPIGATKLDEAVAFCVENKIDYVVVAPDDPLALGMVDRLAERGIPAFGPSAAAAQIEASKVFAKDLMRKYGIPTAQYETFSEGKKALEYIQSRESYPVVVKADGLALGKGVIICQNYPEAQAAIRSIMEDKIFGESGARVVVEEFLTGPEVSVLAFCDGKTLVPMVSSMDHKRVGDGDTGPNTGGMGTIAPNPFYTEEIARRCMQEIFLPTVDALQKEGAPFKGCLYFGLMLTPQGPRVIEYNCRFGDPETQVVLRLLDGDLLSIMQACTNGTLQESMVGRKAGAAACVVMASGGYPGDYPKGLPITGADAPPSDVLIYHAGTRLEEGRLLTSGGRVLGVSAMAPTLADALGKAYAAAEKIHFKNAHYRRDIGKRALEVQKN